MESVLTVCIITYNHAGYIEAALEGVLEQQVSFNYTIRVADDCSTDGTREILVRYAQQYPGKFDLLLQENNVGPAANFLDLLTGVDSKYICYFEGDDYWIDNSRLQRQFEILERDQTLMGCFHNAWLEDQHSGKRALFRRYKKSLYSVDDILQDWVVSTASLMYRNAFQWGRFLELLDGAPHGDWPFYIAIAEKGHLAFIDRTMSVYRKHDGNATLSSTTLEFNRRKIAWLVALDERLDFGYTKIINSKVAAIHIANSRLMRTQGASIRDSFAELYKSVQLVGMSFFWQLSKSMIFLLIRRK